MQQSFLASVLEDLQKDGNSIENAVYVLPSKRSSVFLKYHLKQKLRKTFFTPTIISIEDFVLEVSGLKKASNIDLLILLYQSYKKLPTHNEDDFDTFIKWGETLIGDFNEIDRYLLPSNDILNYLKSIKEINHWSLQPKKTQLVKNYMDFWENIGTLYKLFQENLLSQNKAYQGLIYRIAAQNIVKYAKEKLETPIYFIGFNALNTAESQIIQYLLEHNDCQIYWDIDQSFLEDPIHDASLFIRRYVQQWPYYSKNKPKGVHNCFLRDKKIEITGVPKNISQAKYIGNIIQDIASEKQEIHDSFAVVLSDESLLTPVTKAIPSQAQDINITMGVTLKNTMLYALFISIFELVDSKSDKGWFYKNVLNLLGNPYFKKIGDSLHPNFTRNLAYDINSNNITHVNAQYINSFRENHNTVLNLFPPTGTELVTIIDYCLSLIAQLKPILKNQKDTLNLQYLFKFNALFLQLKRQMAQMGFIKSIKTVQVFFKQLASTETVDFIGSPIEGIQLMGVLESRTLDFDTVIISSVNEGVLPAGKSNSSFIPFDVKREYGLPTYKEKDAIYTYHFYRLIQRAKNIHIIYNTEADVLEGGEKSRLIAQLLSDQALESFVSHKMAAPQIRIAPETTEKIQKTSLLMTELKARAAKGFSPTSLSNYIKNPIDFYKKHLLGIQDSITFQENIAANTFGTIIHEVLFVLYQPYVGKFLTTDNIVSIQKKTSLEIEHAFKKHLPGTTYDKGRFLLIFHVIERYLKRFLDMELRLVKKHQIKILHLEEKFEMQLNYKELDYPVTLKGIIDRVDEFDGTIRVIDYKTGITEPSQLKIKTWEDLRFNDTKSKAFQLLCYALLFSKDTEEKPIIAGIYAIKNLKSGLMPFSSGNNSIIDKMTLDEFRIQLQQLILEIYNPKIPFEDSESSNPILNRDVLA